MSADARAVHPSISKHPIPRNATDLSTACVLCSHNCGIRVDVEEGVITKIVPDDRNPFTQGYVCNKAMTVSRYATHQQRVQEPLRRTPDGRFEPVSWEEAIEDIAARLTAIRLESGPRSIGVLGFGGQANHMDVPFGGAFVNALGTKRFFNSFAQEKHQHYLVDYWMFKASPKLFFHPDVENTNYLLVMGTNPRISNRGSRANVTLPALSKKEDCRVVVVDPRETETTRRADRHLRVKPAGDAFFLLAVAAHIVEQGLYDESFVGQRSVGFDEIRRALAAVDIDDMADRAGLDAHLVRSVAEEFANAESASIFWDLGVEQTRFSTLISYLIRLNLALTDNIGEGGNTWLELFPPTNFSPEGFENPERALASGIPSIPALTDLGMFSPTLVPEEVMLDHPERLRALVVCASNPLMAHSDTHAWAQAVERLDLLVVIDPAFTETARRADYVLPVPVGYEKWEMALFPKRHPEIDVHVRPPVIPGHTEGLPEAEIFVRLIEAMELCAPLPDDLAAIGAPETPEARAAFMGTAMAKLAELGEAAGDPEAQIIAWAYRGLGHHFPSPVLVAVWALCFFNATDPKRHEDVLRTLGKDWRDKGPFEITEAIFERILAHPEGVEIARTEETGNLEKHLGYEDGKVRLAPEPMLGEIARAIETRLETDPEYPFILASGLRTRWTANLIQRDPAWRKGKGPFCTLHIHPDDAGKVGVATGDTVRVETRKSAIELPTELDASCLPGHVWFPNGFGMQAGEDPEDTKDIVGAPMNTITDVADRDPISGCPHHRYLPAKLTAVPN